jgi:signal transduction histidine kinase
MLKAARMGRLPRRTVRLRLTVLYGALFLISGAALLTMTYFFVAEATGNAFIAQGKNGITIAGFRIGLPPPSGAPMIIGKQGTNQLSGSAHGSGSRPKAGFGVTAGLTPNQARQQSEELQTLAVAYRNKELEQLLIESGVALGIMAFVSVALGYVVAGRVLRPLRVITATTRHISASNLHERLALTRPDDELKELGDTIDELLERLDASFRAQRQFVANASHELRTPLARQRVLAQVALSDPDASTDSLRAAHERILASGEQQEQLIDALLLLSRLQAGAVSGHTVDLEVLVRDLLEVREHDAMARGVRVIPTLGAARIRADGRLVERLAANLIDNALRHNVPDGIVLVQTGSRAGQGWLAVSNDGPLVEPEQIERLYEPFERLDGERTSAGEGFGLGLCIVRAVAAAHGAALTTEARPAGGLRVEVDFPATGTEAPGGSQPTADEARPAGPVPAEGGVDHSRREAQLLAP